MSDSRYNGEDGNGSEAPTRQDAFKALWAIVQDSHRRWKSRKNPVVGKQREKRIEIKAIEVIFKGLKDADMEDLLKRLERLEAKLL